MSHWTHIQGLITLDATELENYAELHTNLLREFQVNIPNESSLSVTITKNPRGSSIVLYGNLRDNEDLTIDDFMNYIKEETSEYDLLQDCTGKIILEYGVICFDSTKFGTYFIHYGDDGWYYRKEK